MAHLTHDLPNLSRGTRLATTLGVSQPDSASPSTPLLDHRSWKRLALPFFGVLLPLCVFGQLASEVREGDPFALDVPLLRWAHAQESPFLNGVAIAFWFLGGGRGLWPLGVLIFALLVRAKRRRAAAFWCIAAGGAALLNLGAKAFFGRPRPALWPSIAPESSWSFPSGHAMGSMAFCAALCVLAWHTRWRWPALAFSLAFVPLVGWTRAYLGVHYPSDVLAGWAASLAWVLGANWALRGVWFPKRDWNEPLRALSL